MRGAVRYQATVVQESKSIHFSSVRFLKMPPPIKFYYDLMSPPSRALLTFFKLANIPFEDKPVALRKGEHMTEEFKKNVNPLSKMPVIADGDFRLTESPAILRYVLGKYKVDDFWYPANPKDQARIDEYLGWTHNNIRLRIGMSFFAKFRDPILFGKKPNPEQLKRLDKDVQKVLDEFESLWTGTAFIAGNKFTVADVFASCDVEQARMTGIDPLENRPKTAAWFNRARKQLEPLFTEHHKYVYIVSEIVKNQKFD